jgi:hypothetical protein
MTGASGNDLATSSLGLGSEWQGHSTAYIFDLFLLSPLPRLFRDRFHFSVVCLAKKLAVLIAAIEVMIMRFYTAGR